MANILYYLRYIILAFRNFYYLKNIFVYFSDSANGT